MEKRPQVPKTLKQKWAVVLGGPCAAPTLFKPSLKTSFCLATKFHLCFLLPPCKKQKSCAHSFQLYFRRLFSNVGVLALKWRFTKQLCDNKHHRAPSLSKRCYWIFHSPQEYSCFSCLLCISRVRTQSLHGR